MRSIFSYGFLFSRNIDNSTLRRQAGSICTTMKCHLSQQWASNVILFISETLLRFTIEKKNKIKYSQRTKTINYLIRCKFSRILSCIKTLKRSIKTLKRRLKSKKLWQKLTTEIAWEMFTSWNNWFDKENSNVITNWMHFSLIKFE